MTRSHDDPSSRPPRDRVDGLDLVDELHAVLPTARRICLTARGDHGLSLPKLREARGRGRIDTYLLIPQGPRDEEFHTAVTEYLSDWGWTASTPEVEGVQIIEGGSRAEVSQIRDFLDRMGIPPARGSLAGRGDRTSRWPRSTARAPHPRAATCVPRRSSAEAATPQGRRRSTSRGMPRASPSWCRHRGGAFAAGGGDPFHRAGTQVAGREDAGHRRLKCRRRTTVYQVHAHVAP